MSLEEFWANQLNLERLFWGPDFIATRHGLYRLDVLETEEWVMSVDQDGAEDLETPDEAVEGELLAYRRERCRRATGRLSRVRRRPNRTPHATEDQV